MQLENIKLTQIGWVSFVSSQSQYFSTTVLVFFFFWYNNVSSYKTVGKYTEQLNNQICTHNFIDNWFREYTTCIKTLPRSSHLGHPFLPQLDPHQPPPEIREILVKAQKSTSHPVVKKGLGNKTILKTDIVSLKLKELECIVILLWWIPFPAKCI
jgi:hypothetical protein